MTDLSTTSFDNECALCRQYLDPQNGTPFLAVSACNPNPDRAEWREVDGLPFLCLNHTTASSLNKRFGELPGIYLVHPYCNDVLATADRKRSLFDCFRALHPVLHEDNPTVERTWPWSSSCAVYGRILRSILTDKAKAGNGNADLIDVPFLMTRLEAFRITKVRLPAELVDMILDQLPFELSLALDYLSGGDQYLYRLRQDPIACRFERAFEILRHGVRDFKHHEDDRIKLEPAMIARFFKLGGKWYLQDLYAKSPEEVSGQGQVKCFPFKHDYHREPYIAVQVDDFGITHIAFDKTKGLPRWIGPNKVHRQAICFQDRSSAPRFENVVVISDGLKLCTVDLPRRVEYPRTRAILPFGVLAFHWSLSPCDLLYVRPTIFDVSKTCGLYVVTSPIPGAPGFRLSDTPRPGYRKLRFGLECSPDAGRTVELISSPPSPETYVHFCHSNIEAPLDTSRKLVSNVVGLWQFRFSCNVIVGDPAVLSSL